MKIAVHQMCSGIDPLENAHMMVSAIEDAARQGAQFYFAPEMSLLLDRDRSRAAGHIVTEKDNRALQIVGSAAAENGIWAHIGSLPVRAEDDGGRYANRSIIFDNEGNIRARYDKIHLFDVDLSTGESWRESSAYRPGGGPVVARTPIGSIGLTICYDMRFPDLYSALSGAGVDILTVPAAFTVPTGQAHWHALLRARAIEAQAFVIAAAQSGEHDDGRRTYGHSLVIDPWGQVILDMQDTPGLGIVELDPSRLAEVRAQIPVQANRRDIGPVIFMD